jgi:predicted ATPase/DNA-binding CsgD family transcriptional regulator
MTATTVRSQAGNLPAEMTSFIGRHRDAAELKRLLQTSRLVTVTGVGGIGKTRLALMVAGQLRRSFPGGVWFSDLGALHDPDLVADQVGTDLGFRNHSGRIPIDALGEYLGSEQLLLVLDNCEHVLDACSTLLAGLLRVAGGLRVIATSRQPLGIAGEHVLALAALSLPDAGKPPPALESFPMYDALTLFVERAHAVTSTFAVTEANHAAVVELCRALDGMPLALELAANRLRMLSPEQILARLDDRFELLIGRDSTVHPRQRSLHALIDWSFDLCTHEEQALWMRLGVFPGGFDLDAAAEICADEELHDRHVLNALAGLVERSLLTPEPSGSRMRYRALDTIREYGLARLAESGREPALRRRHSEYFLGLARTSEAQFCGPSQRTWLAQLAEDHDNLRAALAFSLAEAGRERTALDLAGTLWPQWLMNGYLSEGRQWLDRALAASQEPCSERAKSLWADAWLRLYQGDIEGASSQLEQCERIAEALRDGTAAAHVLEFRGAAALLASDWTTASTCGREAVARHRALGNQFNVIMTLARWGMAAYLMGNADEATACHAEALTLSAECGETWGRSTVLWMHGVVLFDHDELGRAEETERESLRIRYAFQDRIGMAQCIEVLAWIAAARQEYERAARLLGAAVPLWLCTGGKLFPHVQDRDERCRTDILRALGAAKFDGAVEAGSRIGIDAGVALALGEKQPKPSAGAERASVLTPREQEISGLVAEGLSNKEIAARLFISQRTAEAHVEHILTKLGFNSRSQIATWVAEHRKAPG